jgi:hypothetical protein
VQVIGEGLPEAVSPPSSEVEIQIKFVLSYCDLKLYLLCLTQAVPERTVKDSSTVGKPISGSKKLNHCSNGVPVIQKNDSTEIVSNGHITGSAIINHMSDHQNHITKSELALTVNGLGDKEEEDPVNSRGRARERYNPRIHRGENNHLNFMIVYCNIQTGACKIVPQDQLLKVDFVTSLSSHFLRIQINLSNLMIEMTELQIKKQCILGLGWL